MTSPLNFFSVVFKQLKIAYVAYSKSLLDSTSLEPVINMPVTQLGCSSKEAGHTCTDTCTFTHLAVSEHPH